jgi:hypothetical protein
MPASPCFLSGGFAGDDRHRHRPHALPDDRRISTTVTEAKNVFTGPGKAPANGIEN